MALTGGDHRLGLIFVTLAAAWSTTGLFIRYLPLDAATLLVWRGVFGALGLQAFMALSGGGAALGGFARLWLPGLACAPVSAFGMVCFITSLLCTSVAHNSVIYAPVPFMAAGPAWLVARVVPGRMAMAASLVALAGVVLVVGWGGDGGLLGDVLALAMMLVIARRFPAPSTLPAACRSALISAGAILRLSQGLAVPLADIPVLMAFGLVNPALGMTLFLTGSRHLPAISSGPISSLDAPLGPLWVWLVFAETPRTPALIGGALVLAAVVAHIWNDARSVKPG